MTTTISVDYPGYLADSLRLGKDDFGKEMKIFALVKLYELGKISSGLVTRVLNISRLEFMDLLGLYKVSFLSSEDIEGDLKNA